MTRTIFFVAFLLLTNFLLGQATMLKASDSDPKAKKILDALKKEYNGYTSMELSFELEIDLKDKGKEVQQGKFVQQGSKYMVAVNDQEIYCDGTTLWLYLKSNKEVQINNYEEGDNDKMMSPKEMLRIYENGKYAYAIVGNVKENGTNVTQIEFKPLEKKSEYSKIRLSVYEKTKKAKSLTIFNKDGSRYTLNIKNITPNKAYTADTFVFNTKKHPGVSVEDLRID